MRILAVCCLLAAVCCSASAQERPRTQIFFKEPDGMKVHWLTKEKDKLVYSKTPLNTPGRFNFVQGAVYQLKLTHLEGHAGLELFPTLEVAGANPQTGEFLKHNSVPILLTSDEINQVVKGGYLTKVVYLPSQQDGDAGSATVTGQDSIREATKRGQVLIVLRIGNRER